MLFKATIERILKLDFVASGYSLIFFPFPNISWILVELHILFLSHFIETLVFCAFFPCYNEFKNHASSRQFRYFKGKLLLVSLIYCGLVF